MTVHGASTSYSASSDDDAGVIVHIPGRGHIRTSSQQANTSRPLQNRPRSPQLKRKKPRHHHRRPHHHDGDRHRKPQDLVRQRPPSALARSARSNFSLLTHLGASRSDPFNVYIAKDLPMYVHNLMDHMATVACKAYIPSSRLADHETVRSQLMEHAMSDSLAWYSIMMATITHLSFVSGHATVPHRENLLRISYRTKTISLIQTDMATHAGVPSETGLLGIATLIVHGGTASDRPFRHSTVQTRKAFGTANDMHYYSSLDLDATHWHMLARCVQARGGVGAIKLKAMAMVLASADALFAWRTLSPPIMEPFVPTAMAIAFASFRPDVVAEGEMRKMLSGLPAAFRTCPERPYAGLYETMQHVRTLCVRFGQRERRRAERAPMCPDLLQIHMARVLVVIDLLRLEALGLGGKLETVYEMCRRAVLAFMQLVLFPIAENNDMPNRLLGMILPALNLTRNRLRQEEELWQTRPGGRPPKEGEVNSGLLLWAWMLAGMLALEELQTNGKSDWMDELAPLIVDMPIKAEKSTWPLVKGVMQTFLWLNSECDSQGQQWWNYACLWIRARQREDSRLMQKMRPKWAVDAERRHAAVASMPVDELD